MDTHESLNQLQDQHSQSIGLIKDIQKAADEGDWCQYMTLMGGATAKRKDLPLRAKYLIKPDAGIYGEDIRELIGLENLIGNVIKTRYRVWTIGLKRTEDDCADGVMRTGPPKERPLEYCQ